MGGSAALSFSAAAAERGLPGLATAPGGPLSNRLTWAFEPISNLSKLCFNRLMDLTRLADLRSGWLGPDAGPPGPRGRSWRPPAVS